MRPRGKTQQRYNEAIQILSGTQVKNQNFNSKVNIPDKMATKRRQACPQTVLHLWDAIAYIKQQKQIPNFERLSAYMKRVYNLNPSDLERQLNFAVSDGLIVVKKSLGCKGSKVGVEQDGYRIPEDVKERDGHDWYCFECHRGGEVLLCTTCHRVFHEVCITDDVKSGKFVCPVCKNMKKFPVELKKNELNTILGYTCIRLKEKTRELHRIPHPDDEKWRFNFLIYEPMDLVAMEEKMKANEYIRLGDFFTDAQQIVHNVIVYFGMHSRIAEMARQMLGDCEYDLQEIVQCLNCYKMSNTKNDVYWFCQPCDPPHELVYAKVKGFPYWPAKVIRKHENCYDVRFFGAHHQRAIVDDDYVKPISTSFQKLGIKKTAAFDRAYKELCHHQQLVEKASKRKSAGNNKLENDKVIEKSNLESDTVTNVNSSSKSKTPASRKRKSTSLPVAKPPSAKKSANVPVKKNKKFYQESPTSSSPKNISSQDLSVSDDINDHNLVSSSSQEAAVSYTSIGVQTENEVTENVANPSDKDLDKNPNNEKTCDCSAKYEKAIQDLHIRLEEEHKKDKSRALKEFSENLQKELQMENEKQKYLSSALEKLQQEHQEAMRKLQEEIETKHKLQIKTLTEEHKTFLSETKKKQWCYNCENEAIYHCCWNTSYCSVECQQVHWHKEHKRTCRRKREIRETMPAPDNESRFVSDESFGQPHLCRLAVVLIDDSVPAINGPNIFVICSPFKNDSEDIPMDYLSGSGTEEEIEASAMEDVMRYDPNEITDFIVAQ
ncbi:Zinc finger MYND domain-containing protein 11 [Argiope bruennichi]|uniref:Zinc finger MYND domain-containing protein 11 n=2 Tax=Argiope bruennichi TaxID=94029 RepID=A0A8T0G483_ARGBR|nr:Zinc finger MYND domain-containing protein 11 [Argiope bruennichi]